MLHVHPGELEDHVHVSQERASEATAGMDSPKPDKAMLFPHVVGFVFAFGCICIPYTHIVRRHTMNGL